MRNDLLNADKKKEPVQQVWLRFSQNNEEKKANVKRNTCLKALSKNYRFHGALYINDFKNHKLFHYL